MEAAGLRTFQQEDRRTYVRQDGYVSTAKPDGIRDIYAWKVSPLFPCLLVTRTILISRVTIMLYSTTATMASSSSFLTKALLITYKVFVLLKQCYGNSHGV